MNKTQTRIIGWGLVFLGFMMVAGAFISNQTVYNWRGYEIGGGFKDFVKSPLLYVGLMLCIAGVVVLAGNTKGGKPILQGKDNKDDK